MFGNFLYFIIVLLIYLIYPTSEEPNFSGAEALIYFIGLIVIFFLLTRFQFKRLEKQVRITSFSTNDHRFNAILVRQSIMAILIFAIDLYGLNLPSYFIKITLFSSFPTLLAVLFLGLFVFYLALVWSNAHDSYQKLYTADISKKSYVLSNISFSIPILLPWVILSSVADVINILPFASPKWFLNTTLGQVIYFLIFLFGIAVIGPLIIQKFWRCKPLKNGFERNRIESLCAKANLEYADILYWPIFGGRMITAGVMGLVKKFRYILVTNALLGLLEPEELDTVIAHEIGHVKKKHLVFYLIFFAGFLLLSFSLFDWVIYLIYSAESFYWLLDNTSFNQGTVISIIYSLVFISIFLIYFRFIFGYFMRNFERQADIYVFALFDSARPLINTLKKIAATSGQSSDRPNWHHFNITQRIDYLTKCEMDSGWISRHEKKVRNSIAVYVAGLLVVGGIGYFMNIGLIRPKLNSQFIEKVLLKELESSPDNPYIYSLMGDLYYENKDYPNVREAYERSIELKPDNPSVLNNLAWFYATCEEPSLRNPARALELAKSAASLETSSYIFDTLAECYYVNGMFAQAVDAAKRALALSKENRAYYERQLRRFEKAHQN
jgi:Zn-dependent protease with chaperone function